MTFYFTGTMPGKPAAVLTLLDSIKTMFPTGMTFDVPSSGDVLDDSTGELTGAWSASGGGQVVGSGGGSWAAGVGGRAVFETSNIHLHRRVRGSHFLVPLVVAQYDSSGTIANATLTAWQGTYNAFLAATTPDWRVWSRPNSEGAFAVSSVTACSFPDKVSTLRSRRV